MLLAAAWVTLQSPGLRRTPIRWRFFHRRRFRSSASSELAVVQAGALAGLRFTPMVSRAF
ncbi:hypothetical protein DEO72_LG5g1965 [Vigna unguiculata]|uniref:Uncharacterized protein n=1 Tax=Vigna unguiculata TaxID=3917 RepID=A0A4D6LY15_VIGUN|nr:hypothetical protein DEO72_LG5g1965 [Vigna unguiculata]